MVHGMSGTWRRLTEYADDHHGTISAALAHQMGASTSTLVAWCEHGRLIRRAPEAYVVAGTPATWHQRVAVAAASTKGWASHRTAAALWELRGFDRRQIEVVTPRWARRGRVEWIVHETSRLRGVDLVEVSGIPCTSVARTILDLPAVATPFAVGEALDDACRRWPGILAVVTQRFLELAGRGRKGTQLLRAMLQERHGTGRFAQSGFETMARLLVQEVGLPDPVLQHHVQDDDFSAYLDMAWPPIRWAVECDSLAWHGGKRPHEWDRYRRRRIKERGWDLVEVTYDDVTKRRHETGQQLRRLYQAREAAILASLSSSC